MRAPETKTHDIARLIISCPDQPGIVAAVSELIAEVGGNIISLDQYSTGVEEGRFFQRTVFHLPAWLRPSPRWRRRSGPSWRTASPWSIR